jgi:hypothetical protein
MRARLARLTNRLVWARPGRAARKLYEFARAEHGSMIDLHAAAKLTRSVARRSTYLRHALDESRHATLFFRRARELGEVDGIGGRAPPRADSEALFERLGEERFLAFVYRAERRGRRQFETYRDHFRAHGDDRTGALFDAVLADERRHEEYSRALLTAVCGGEVKARRALRWAAGWEAWRAWRRAGRFIAERVFSLAMMALYLALAPVGLLLRLAAPARRGWLTPR